MNSTCIKWINAALVLSGLALAVGCSRAPESPVVFATPEAAAEEVAKLLENRDEQRIDQVFGPGSVDLFRSGDDEADQEDIQRVKELIAGGVAFEEHDENTLIALFGADEWPWPIPLVREGEGWRFDTAKGREELLNRRIGRNELFTLETLHEVVDAQREYYATGRDGNPPAFAQRFLSSEGKRDGLYWPSDDPEDLSPLGDLLAESEVEERGTEPEPFHGYFYRMLLKQGPNAPGGERTYVDEQGLMTGGFAAIAWPAKHGNSGVMTFITDRHGIVYQKDLGADTEALGAAIDSFDPDESWMPTPDSAADVEASE